MTKTEPAIGVDDMVRLWIGPPKRGGWQYGVVIGVDTSECPGIEIRFEAPVNGLETCYATHDEVELIKRAS